PIAWRHTQIVEFPGPIQHRQLAHGYGLDPDEPLDTLAAEQILRIGALELWGSRKLTHPCSAEWRHRLTATADGVLLSR
ncbi:MAG: hypothetical protein JXA90_13885, partial [Planctomycetes bacterium]|nr:hypothetical protein [Planctomycetota bacterium]